MNTLAIDVGGTHVKVLASGRRKPLEIPSGPKMTAKEMVRQVREGTTGWRYSFVSIGYPGPVLHGKPVSEPPNLGGGWVGVGNAKLLESLPKGVRLGSNANAFLGGYRLWEDHAKGSLRRLGVA